MTAQVASFIAMASVSPPPKIAAKVHELVIAGVCLVCDGQSHKRGLCKRHYAQFLRRKKERGGKAAQAEFEANAIREGKVLAVQQCREIKRDDPFGDL